MKDLEKLLDPNTYTEKSMPLTTALCRELDNTYFSAVSEDISKCRKNHEHFSNEAAEHFNRGFRLGVLLMTEILG